MKIKTEDLLNDLKEKTSKMITEVEFFKQLSKEELNRKPAEDKWSILECIGHLNFYSDFYLIEFESKISNAKQNYCEYHKIGFIGNKFAKSMLPVGDRTPMKMKTFKSKNPVQSELSLNTLQKFISQQREIIRLIDRSRSINITKTKCRLTIKSIKLRLGDALMFYTFHNVRHIVQASKILGKKFEF